MWPAPCLILSKIAPASILFLLIILLLLQHATLVNPKHITKLDILPSEINKYIGGQLQLFQNYNYNCIKIRNNDLTSDIRCHTGRDRSLQISTLNSDTPHPKQIRKLQLLSQMFRMGKRSFRRKICQFQNTFGYFYQFV